MAVPVILVAGNISSPGSTRSITSSASSTTVVLGCFSAVVG